MPLGFIPALEWQHPTGPTTCDFCYDTIAAYDGIIVLVGSPEYAEISGPYHPSCAQQWGFRLVTPLELGRPVLGIIDSIPPESKVWSIPYKSLWPVVVFAAMIDKAKDKPVKEPDLGYQDIDYSEELIAEAVAFIRRLIKAGKKTLDTIKNDAIMKYGLNGTIAVGEVGI